MNWNKLSDIGGTMNKKKRIEEIRLARLRELLIAAIRERSGKVVALPSAAVMPIIFKNILDNINYIHLPVFFTKRI